MARPHKSRGPATRHRSACSCVLASTTAIGLAVPMDSLVLHDRQIAGGTPRWARNRTSPVCSGAAHCDEGHHQHDARTRPPPALGIQRRDKTTQDRPRRQVRRRPCFRVALPRRTARAAATLSGPSEPATPACRSGMLAGDQRIGDTARNPACRAQAAPTSPWQPSSGPVPRSPA